MSYNTAAKVRPWSDLGIDLRLKWWKNYTYSMHAVFATYAYELDEQGNPYVGTHTEWGKGRFGRFQGMSQNFSFTLTPEKLKKLFGGGDDSDSENSRNKDDDEGVDTSIETNIDDDMEAGKHGAKKRAERPRPMTMVTWLSICLGRFLWVTVSPCVRILAAKSSTRAPCAIHTSLPRLSTSVVTCASVMAGTSASHLATTSRTRP